MPVNASLPLDEIGYAKNDVFPERTTHVYLKQFFSFFS